MNTTGLRNSTGNLSASLTSKTKELEATEDVVIRFKRRGEKETNVEFVTRLDLGAMLVMVQLGWLWRST